ncbi:MAG: serine hydrolase, partial [Acidobacteria bacterium]|nr:serine hydrolase [Acidobacteriota bacterium]
MPSLAASAVRVPPPSPVPAGEVVAGSLGHDLDHFLAGLSKKGFSGAVLVAVDGTILLKQGYGLADREGGVANDSETLFDIGPLARILTAAAIMKLADGGHLDVADPISRYLGPFPDLRGTATIHQLLISTSGVVANDAQLDDRSRPAFINSVKKAPAGSTPGSEFQTSAAGYTLLAAVVEKVSGLSFASYLSQELLVPAGMNSTGFAWESRWRRRTVAVGYEVAGLADLTPVPVPVKTWGQHGPGSIVTTMGDLYRWVLAMKNGTLLSPAARREMFSAYIGVEGYAWHVIDNSTRGRLVWRGGMLPGFESSLRWYRDADLVILFAINSNMGFRMKVARGIDDILKRHIPAP